MSDKNNTCTICLDEISDKNVSYLPCCHGFHQECFTNYVTEKIKSKKNVSCPICRIEHFVYGHRDYEFIMNELGITYDVERNRNALYEQYIPSGLQDSNLTRININLSSHSIITMPMPVSPNSNTVRTPTRRRQQQQTSCNVFWFKYRYYILIVVLVLVISSVSFLFISHH